MPRDQQVPRSVRNLWQEARVSHRGVASSVDILNAISTGGEEEREGRHSLALAIQESTTWDLIELLIDEVLDGRASHLLIRQLHDQGSIRRSDLVEWSEVFA